MLYVDDFIVAGPKEFHAKIEKLIGSVMDLYDWGEMGRYLGCHRGVDICGEGQCKGAKRVRFGMHDYMLHVCKGYMELAGITKLKFVNAHFLDLKSFLDKDWEVKGKLEEDAASISMVLFYG